MVGDILLLLAGIALGFWACILHGGCSRRAVRFRFGFGPVFRKERPMPLEVQITNEQKVKITVAPVTETGNPAELDDPVAVTILSGESTVDRVDDTSFFLVSSDSLGDTLILVSGDADLGSGVVTVEDTIRLTVVGALAANLGLVAGTPEPK